MERKTKNKKNRTMLTTRGQQTANKRDLWKKISVLFALFMTILILNVATAMAQYQSHNLTEMRIIDADLVMYDGGNDRNIQVPDGGICVDTSQTSCAPTAGRVSANDIYATDDIYFYGDLRPDGSACADGQILTRTAANNWDCAADSTAATLCANGEFLNGDGTCDTGFLDADGVDADSGGDITGITTAAGSGLSGGCTSGTCTLTMDSACSNTQILKSNGAGSWSCTSDNVNDADSNTANEIQTLGTSGNTITLTSGGSVTAPFATVAGSGDSATGFFSSGTVPTTYTAAKCTSTTCADADADATNEIQTIDSSGVTPNVQIDLSNGGGSVTCQTLTGSPDLCDGDDAVNDADSSPTNELQNTWYSINTPSGPSSPKPDTQQDTLNLAASGIVSISGTDVTDTITIGATETDPQVGTTTNTDVCYGTGTQVSCDDGSFTWNTGTNLLTVGDLRVDFDNIDSGSSGNLYLDPDNDGGADVVIGSSSTSTAGDDLLVPDGRVQICSSGTCPSANYATVDGELYVEGDLETDNNFYSDGFGRFAENIYIGDGTGAYDYAYFNEGSNYLRWNDNWGSFGAFEFNGVTSTSAYFEQNTFSTVGSDVVCWDGSGASSIGDCISLRAFKDNIENLSIGLETVMKLTPREYDWIPEKGGEHDLGFIAEEVEEINPLIAEYNGKNLTSVKYRHMVALITKAIQEQQVMIEEQDNQIDQLTAIVCLDHPKADICNA